MISVVLATHNEETNLARCLDSVKSFASEIIIVDGSSVDKTVDIAKKYKAKIIATSNKPNFHINKQMGIDAASKELILQLDADETVDDELAAFITSTAKSLQKSLKSLPLEALITEMKSTNQPVAWWIKRKNLFLGKFLTKGGQYPDPVIRFFINGTALLPQQDVHEQIKVNGEVGVANGHLIHYANPSFYDYLRKWNTYTSFKAQQLKDINTPMTLFSTIKYVMYYPLTTFFLLYFRHKGFVDGIPGLVFALMSALHHVGAYIKLWEIYITEKK